MERTDLHHEMEMDIESPCEPPEPWRVGTQDGLFFTLNMSRFKSNPQRQRISIAALGNQLIRDVGSFRSRLKLFSGLAFRVCGIQP